MKLFKRASLAVLLLALFALPAHAGWHQRELRWYKSSIRSASDASLYVRDTAFNVLAGGATLSGALDTTMTFSPSDGTPFRIGTSTVTVEASPRRDSLAVGFLVFMTDSTVIQTGGMSSLQLMLDGRASGPIAPLSAVSNAAGWSQIDSLSIGMAVGAPSFAFPIPLYLGGVGTGNARLAGMFGQSILAFENVRARAITSVGALPAARVFWRYWVPEFEELSPR